MYISYGEQVHYANTISTRTHFWSDFQKCNYSVVFCHRAPKILLNDRQKVKKDVHSAGVPLFIFYFQTLILRPSVTCTALP